MPSENEIGSGEQAQLRSALGLPDPQQESESPEIIQSLQEEPIPPNARTDLLQHETLSKKDRQAIESIDSMSAAPVPENQNMNMLQHESESTRKKDSEGIESIDYTNAAPVPENLNMDMLQHESDDSAIKAKLRETPQSSALGAVEEDSFPINPENEDHEKVTVEHVARISSNESLPINDSHVTASSLPMSESHVTTRPTVLTAETTLISGSTSNFDGAEILIPEATLVLENDPAIPSASIVEPERNVLTIMGKKINPIFLGCGILAVLIVVVSLSVALTRSTMGPPPNDDAPSSAPSLSMYPTSTPSIEPSNSPTSLIFSELLSIITEKTGYDESQFSGINSSRRMALDWLADDLKAHQQKSRSLYSTYSEIEILERFSMALLYFETHGDDWFDSFQFLTQEHICKWRGKRALQKKGVIRCTSDNRVAELALFDNNLKGLIPFEMGLLSELTLMNFAINDISGSLPPLNNLTNLAQVMLNNNDFDGVMPDFSALPHLQVLDVSNNEFDGTIFDVSNLTELRNFNVAGNKLSGEVPIAFQDLTLETLHLQRNKLSGAIDFLCANLPTDVDLDCFDDTPEVQCNCCKGCTFVNLECNATKETVAFININEASEDFFWEVYRITEDWNKALIAAGGYYEDGEVIDINLCIPFPGDYLLVTKSNGTEENGDFFTIGDYSTPLVNPMGFIRSKFSLDEDGHPYNVPTQYPTTSPISFVPTSSQYPTSISTPVDTPTVGTNKTLSPTPGVERISAFPTTLSSQWENSQQTQAESCLNLDIKLSTDAFGEETTYYVYKKDNTQVASGISFESNMTYDLYECLDPKECYHFMIVDEFDDGICCDSGLGNYSVSLNSRMVGQGGEFLSSETLQIGGNCGPEVTEDTSCPEGYVILNVTVKTDQYPYENDWGVSSKFTNQTVAVNKYVPGTGASSELSCVLKEGCYDFWIRDSAGDGWFNEDAFWMVQFDGEVVGRGSNDTLEYMDSVSFGPNC